MLKMASVSFINAEFACSCAEIPASFIHNQCDDCRKILHLFLLTDHMQRTQCDGCRSIASSRRFYLAAPNPIEESDNIVPRVLSLVRGLSRSRERTLGTRLEI